MDLAKLTPKDDDAFLHLIGPDEEPLFYEPARAVPEGSPPPDPEPVGVYLRSKDSLPYREAQRRVQKRAIGKGGVRRNGTLSDEALRTLTSDKVSAEILSAAVSSTRGLTYKGVNLDNLEGERLREAFADVLVDAAWIKEQVDEFIGDRGNWIGAD